MQGIGLEYIFLDLGGVLYSLKYDRVWDYFSHKCGISVDEVQEILYATDLFYPYETGLLSTKTFYQSVMKRFPCTIEFDEFSNTWNSLLVKREDIFQIAHRLKNFVDLLILSNTNELNARFIDPDVRALTDKVIYSYQIGYLKPDRRIYEKALGVAGSAPERTLFIDDRHENVEGAKRVGIIAHEFRSKNNFLQLLRSYDIRSFT